MSAEVADPSSWSHSQAALRFLLSPAAHPHGRRAPELIETHMAWVVLGDRTVMKLKKPVCVPPLYDCRSLPAREREARAELRLNRRLAPGVYLGLLALRSDGERWRLTPEENLGSAAAADADAGWHTVDWIVQMRRLPGPRMLDRAIAAGRVQPAQVEAVALLLSRFWLHARPSPIAPPQHVQRIAAELRRHRELLLQPRFAFADALPALDAFERALARETGALERRVRLGRIVDGHGDLRPEHICLGTDGGEPSRHEGGGAQHRDAVPAEAPVVIDALTFHDALRQLDPFEELEALALDCERLGGGWIGTLLIERCIERLDDDPGPSLRRLYRAESALLRARLAAAHLLDAPPREPQRWIARAQVHLGQALRALAAPVVA